MSSPQLAKAAHDELLSEFKGKILPANHPLTRHVNRVVTRILDASNLGVLKSASPKPLQQTQAHDGTWDPDGLENGRTEDVVPGAGGRQWELIVVNDDTVVNAAATYGVLVLIVMNLFAHWVELPGNIVVFTGILPVAKDEQGLAAVLGHGMLLIIVAVRSMLTDCGSRDRSCRFVLMFTLSCRKCS